MSYLYILRCRGNLSIIPKTLGSNLIFCPKSFVGSENSSTFAPAKREPLLARRQKKEFFERFT